MSSTSEPTPTTSTPAVTVGHLDFGHQPTMLDALDAALRFCEHDGSADVIDTARRFHRLLQTGQGGTPQIGDIVWYHSRVSEYDCPAVVVRTVASQSIEAAERAGLMILEDPTVVDLVVLSAGPTSFGALPEPGSIPGPVSVGYREASVPVNPYGDGSVAAGTWRWPTA